VSTLDPWTPPIEDRCITPDGLGIATYDFGGSGDDLLLVHATGFCAAVLGPLAERLGDRYHCWGIDLRAHGRSDRPADGNFHWAGFALDVLSAIDHLGLEDPVGFGHSCGGAAVLLAEQARPATFRSLYTFEPVVFPHPEGSPESALMEENALSIGARRRRETFPSAGEAITNFSSKPMFASLDPRVLQAYVEYGFEPVPDEDGGDGMAIRLRCRRNDEADVYAHGYAHDAFAHLGEVQCLVALACGEDTDSMGPSVLAADAAQLPRATIDVLAGLGHFGPLEQPGVVGHSVIAAMSTSHETPSP
jgi:pimeloyl-ACP methyl ester carboxylesterase